ncbi:protein regulator of cytokinesis 1 isoform X2 [Nothobranchius furzeri]|uniref:protein regulator of cytokinesis 1 isoform X2 n=1 Tax=Nothobranchius furzeri TaxID=105023 RepID=UPI0024048781|nr:protein regulator of cytokinesis 1 isoform X2 [Nothobranchius furzeri]
MRLSEVHAAESVAYLNRSLARLQDIWEEIGIPDEQRVQRTNAVHKHTKSLLDKIIEEEKSLKNKLLKSIEACRKELANLCDELQLPPFEEEEGCSTLQTEKNNRTRLEALKKQKKQRMEELKGLVAKDRELCNVMCTSPFSIDQSAVPSMQQLEAYRTYLANLTKEKECRLEEFVTIRKEVIACMEDLEQHPETSFEMDVVCEDVDAFCLSNDNIAALKLVLSQLHERKAENELVCAGFRTKIQELWQRLQIPQEEREALSEHMVNSKKKNIEALQSEIQRLEVLKIQSMQRIIKVIREELALLWKKCFYSLEQQEAFLPYHDDDFTEELLSRHEEEVRRLQRYYEQHKQLFEGVSKWQNSWTLYLELDKKNSDPSRFNNRGGNLLKEERQRTDLQKSLPKVEKILKAQIEAWEEEHGKEFLVGGQRFLEYVHQQWEKHHEEKEKEKLERQLKKSIQTKEEMLFGATARTPSKRQMPGTPVAAKLRKLNGTSTISTPNSLLSPSLSGAMCQSLMQKPPLSANKGLGLRTPGRGKMPLMLEQNKENICHVSRNPPCDAPKLQEPPNQTFNSIAGSYSEFTRDLTKASKSHVPSGLLNSTVDFK